MTVAEQLAEFALGIRFSDLPGSTVAAAKRVLLDTLGCAIGAIGCEPALIAANTMSTAAVHDGGATVIGGGRAPVEHAALVNGVLARYLDFMDVYWSMDVCHPSENIPLALACVESVNGSGEQLIEAIVTGYEAQIRLANAFSFTAAGMHHVSAGGFVAPLVIGKVWQLPAPRLAHAVALGGMRHLALGALAKGRLSMAKAIGYPLSAMEGFFAAKLAANGFTGPLECLEWLFSQVSSRRPPPAGGAMDFNRAAFCIERVSLKQFPVQFELQSPVEVAIRIHRKLGAAAANIRRVVVEVPAVTKERTADPAKFQPANRETADHSLPCCVAMALIDGNLEFQQFERGRWNADDARNLVAKTEVVVAPDLEAKFPGKRPVRITVELNDGARCAEEEAVPLGDAERPLDEAALVRKFKSLAAGSLGESVANEIVDTVSRIDQLADVRRLAALLRKPV